MLYHFVKGLSRVVCLLPTGLRNKIGDFIGALCWPLVPRKRRDMAINNAATSMGIGNTAATKLVKQSAIRFGRMFMEVLCFPKLNRENIDKHVVLEGRQHLENAYALGRGVIVVSSHSGNWELVGPTLALKGFPFVGVTQRQTNDAMDKFINEYRCLSGMRVTYKTGVREMVTLLGEGMAIGLMIDQDAKEQGAFVNFLGRLASVPQGAAALGRLKDAPIVPLFIAGNDDGTHTITVYPAVLVTKTNDRDADLQQTMQELTLIVEQHVRAYPHEWFWLHNRWKTRPPAK